MPEVERILASRFSKAKNKCLYLVRWRGFEEEEDTWEPLEGLDACEGIVDVFLATQDDRNVAIIKDPPANEAVNGSARDEQLQSNPSPAKCQRLASGATVSAVRRGVRADAPALVTLFVVDPFFDHSKAQPALSEAFVIETLEDPLFEWLVAIDTAAGKPALVGAVCFKWLPSPKLSVLKKFKVSPSHRGQGLGRRLLAVFRGRLDAAMCEQNMGTARTSTLKVWRKNEGAMRLYSSLGWQREFDLVLKHVAPRQYISLFLTIDCDRDIRNKGVGSADDGGYGDVSVCACTGSEASDCLTDDGACTVISANSTNKALLPASWVRAAALLQDPRRGAVSPVQHTPRGFAVLPGFLSVEEERGLLDYLGTLEQSFGRRRSVSRNLKGHSGWLNLNRLQRTPSLRATGGSGDLEGGMARTVEVDSPLPAAIIPLLDALHGDPYIAEAAGGHRLDFGIATWSMHPLFLFPHTCMHVDSSRVSFMLCCHQRCTM
jgi:GNAT superfamily N-acetyltransferase